MDELQKWAADFNEKIDNLPDQPMREIFIEDSFKNYRLSYGIASYFPSVVYFMAIRPAFCVVPKFMWHYSHLSDLALDVLGIQHFSETLPADTVVHDRAVSVSDVVAVIFALLRNKESIELFQEQKDLMDLGLKHFHLDNFYQDFIRGLCNEYYHKGTFLGRPLKELSIFSKMKGVSGDRS